MDLSSVAKALTDDVRTEKGSRFRNYVLYNEHTQKFNSHDVLKDNNVWTNIIGKKLTTKSAQDIMNALEQLCMHELPGYAVFWMRESRSGGNTGNMSLYISNK